MPNKKSKNKINGILLSIGVLAYNNFEELKKFLLSALPQMQPGVEIVINDNSTNSEIELMIKKEFNNSYVRYFRNKENVGAERNKILAAERTLGRYIWWFGNDEMSEGAIQHVVDILRKNPDISFVFVNFHIADQGLSNPAVKIIQDKLFRDNNQVLEEIANALGFMSSLIVKKEKLGNINKDELERFIDLTFANLYIALHVLAQNGKAYFIAYPYVCCHPTPPGMADFDGFSVFAVNFFKIAKNFERYFSKKSLKKMLAKNFGHVWRAIFVGSVRGYEIPRRRIKTLLKYYWNFPEFWIILPFLAMPRSINIFLYKIYKKIEGSNQYLKNKLSKVPWF